MGKTVDEGRQVAAPHTAGDCASAPRSASGSDLGRCVWPSLNSCFCSLLYGLNKFSSLRPTALHKCSLFNPDSHNLATRSPRFYPVLALKFKFLNGRDDCLSGGPGCEPVREQSLFGLKWGDVDFGRDNERDSLDCLRKPAALWKRARSRTARSDGAISPGVAVH